MEFTGGLPSLLISVDSPPPPCRSSMSPMKSSSCCPSRIFIQKSSTMRRSMAAILSKDFAREVYPNIKVVTDSPPYKPEFSPEENRAIVDAINAADPDLLWIGMTAPKQEKWTYQHWPELKIHCHVGTIGAVFDFFAGTVKRAPLWWQNHGLEWLYRLLKEPRRMWRRYVVGNVKFLRNVRRERRSGE